jgi:hypothetical protein
MTPLRLSELSLSHRVGTYHLKLRSGPFSAECVTDHNLGLIMSAFSAALKELDAQARGVTEQRKTEMITGRITLDCWTIDDAVLAPYWWSMTMTSGRFVYTVRMDREVEHVLLAFQGALKFFSFKYGLTTLDAEVVRNRDRAGEDGMLTREDFR